MRMKRVMWTLGMTSCIALGSLTLAASVLSQPADELQKWIAEHAITVRSIDAADEDFSDLEPLIDAIGSARVVQLGEPDHGAGGSFAAKVRLIKFLHQRMGFDVLAWESGLYGLRLTQAGLRAGEDAVTAAQRGILKVWSDAEEARPLFEYAKATQAGTRPLDMAGFDMQITAAKSAERFAADLRSFVRALRDPALQGRASGLADQAVAAHERLYARIEALMRKRAESAKAGQTGKALEETMAAWETREGYKLRSKKEDLESLHQAADGLLATISSHRAAFEQVHGTAEITFMERAIENMRGDGTTVYDRERPDRPTDSALHARRSEEWNRRDTLMANNLRWLIQEGFPGRKIIVWAHNAHVMNAYFAADWRSVHLEPQPGGMKPSGMFLAEWLKEDAYTIALTTYEGQGGWVTADRVSPIAPAVEGSLESRLHRLGKPYVFLDFRALDGSPEHPLHTPQSMRISGYGLPSGKYGNDTVPDLTKAFDAVFYIDRMTPATRVRHTRDGGGPN